MLWDVIKVGDFELFLLPYQKNCLFIANPNSNDKYMVVMDQNLEDKWQFNRVKAILSYPMNLNVNFFSYLNDLTTASTLSHS